MNSPQMKNFRSISTPTMRLVMRTDGKWFELVHTDLSTDHETVVASDSKPLNQVWNKQVLADGWRK